MEKGRDMYSIPGTSLRDGFSNIIKIKEESSKMRTAANYRSSAYKVVLYLGAKAAKFRLRDVTPEWVNGFVEWLHSQHLDKPQTVDFYFRNVRAMCNHLLLLQQMKWPGGINPFKGIVIKGIRLSKRALSAQEAEVLLTDSFRSRLKRSHWETLDILRFILYMRGMVFQDVYNLRWDMVSADGHIQYLRSKTGCPIDVAIPIEAMEMMERYHRADSPFVFPFLHTYQRNRGTTLPEESVLRRINQQARLIGEQAGLPIPLTTYVMRHTWATLMLESGKPVELIGQCLGHTSIRTTQIYLSNISVSRIDREVDDMVNRMLRTEKKDTKSGTKKNAEIHVKSEKKVRQKRKKKSSPLSKAAPASRKRALSPKKILFLAKKENKLSALFRGDGLSVAKILIYNILSKFIPIFLDLISPDNL